MNNVLTYEEFKQLGYNILFIDGNIKVMYESDKKHIVNKSDDLLINTIIEKFYNYDLDVNNYCKNIPIHIQLLLKHKYNKWKEIIYELIDINEREKLEDISKRIEEYELKIDIENINDIILYLRYLLNINENIGNKYISLFVINKLMLFMLKIKLFIINTIALRETCIKKIKEIKDDIKMVFSNEKELILIYETEKILNNVYKYIINI